MNFSAEDILKIIADGESEKLDLKQRFHDNNADLVHDILCLCNSRISSNRYILFGVDDDGTIVGVENDAQRKNQAQVIDLLRNSMINHLPTIYLYSVEVDSHTIDVLEIKNLPEKPYYITKEFRSGKKSVRAGAVYIRNGDTNTPCDQSADDLKLELMFRERFGIDEPPKKRLANYLHDRSGWQYGYNEHGHLYFYYDQFPEFTFTKKRPGEKGFQEEWVMLFPDSSATFDIFYLMYHGTILVEMSLVWCDGGRYVTVLPKKYTIEQGSFSYRSYYFTKDSLEYLANEMVQSVFPISSSAYATDVFSIFPKTSVAINSLLGDVTSKKFEFCYFYFNRSDGEYYLLKNGKTLRMTKT